MNESSAVKLLNQHLKKKKQEFRSFSIRRMSTKLSVSPAYLSQILRGKRKVPANLVDQLCNLLDIDSEKRVVLCRHLLREHGWGKMSLASRTVKEKNEWISIPTHHFDLLSEWHLIAILETTLLHDYDGSIEFISRRLGLQDTHVRFATSKLEAMGYLKQIDGILKKSKPFFEFHSKNSKSKIRHFHKNGMKKAQEILDKKITDIDLEQRLITSATVTCSVDAIPDLKLKIAKFLKKITTEAASGQADEVYQIAIQFFPITQ